MAEGVTAAQSFPDARQSRADMAIDEIEQYAAILAAETTPANAAEELRRIADELETLQPQAN